MKTLDEALNYIAATEGGTVAHFLEDHPGTGKKLLEDLEKKGLIKYEGSSDEGTVFVFLTEAGQLAFRKADK